MAIKIFTDSTSDIPKDLAEKYDITIIPLTIEFNDNTYFDWYDLNHEDFMNILVSSDELPKTSQIPPARFMDYYTKAIDNGDSIISIHITSKASGTYQSALIAKDSFDNADITVIDSKHLSMGLGVIVLEAAKMAQSGHTKEDILKRIDYLIPRIHCSFHVDTLDYLRKGGRVNAAQAIMSTALNIKPIITMTDGEILVTDKVRGKNKVIAKFVDWVKTYYDKDVMKEIHICCDKIDDFILDYKDKIEEISGKGTVYLSQYGTVIATYCGPGTISVIFTHKNPLV